MINLRIEIGRHKDQTERRRFDKNEADVGVMWPEANDCELPAEAGKAKERLSPTVSRRSAALLTTVILA